MSILNKLAIKNLKLNKKRTISTIIGIALSAALICAVGNMFESIRNTYIRSSSDEGYNHVALYNLTEDQIKDVSINRDVKDLNTLYHIGKVEDSSKCFYMNMDSAGNFDPKGLGFRLLDGNFPKDNSEIAVTKKALKSIGTNLKIGDTVNLGQKESEDNSCTYKIVGVIAQRSDTDILTVKDTSEQSISYVVLKNPVKCEDSLTKLLGADSYEDIKNYKNVDKMNYIYKLNDGVLGLESFDLSNEMSRTMLKILVVVLAVIIFTSIYCIKNSFSISVSEKLKTYGLLSSVGATKKQIRKSVKHEAMILGLIGIPIGVLLGTAIVWILIKISNHILNVSQLTDLGQDNLLMFKISIPAVLLSIILSFITVHLSAYSSAKKAGKITPVELMKNSQEIKINKKSLKTPRIISKVFKTGGVIAYKNLKRNKKKYKTTVVSITISVLLLISMGTYGALFSNTINEFAKLDSASDYNIQITSGNGGPLSLSDDQINKISSLNDVEEKYMLYVLGEPIKITDEKMLSDAILDAFKEKPQSRDMFKNVTIYGLDSSSFKKYANKINTDYDAVKDKGILIDNTKLGKQNNEENRVFNYEIGDSVKGVSNGQELSIQVGARTNILPYGQETKSNACLVVDASEYSSLNFGLRSISIKASDATEAETSIKRIATGSNVCNTEGLFKAMHCMKLIGDIFEYSFLVVIMLIGVTNIFNVVTTSVELRRREFAVLKSIGMTKKEFNRMINLETLFYGTKSLILGILLGSIISYVFNLLFKLISAALFFDTQSYIPIKEVAICIVVVYALIFTIMRCSIRKINKKNIIETIREDNI